MITVKKPVLESGCDTDSGGDKKRITPLCADMMTAILCW